MDSLLDRIRRSAAQRGYVGTMRLCAVQLLWMMVPRFRQTAARRTTVDAAFDRQYGVDTAGVFRPKPSEVIGNHWAFGVSYQPADPSTFVDSLRRLDLAFSEFTFVDFGSGKGRALLLASLFPFKRIIGVEYCRALNNIARQNALKFRPPDRVCPIIETHDGDAAEFPIPEDPLLLFLYNPFSHQVMSKVIRNVADSYRRNPRRIIVIYLFPELESLWESSGVFARTNGTPAIFDTEPASLPITRGVAVAQAIVFLKFCAESASMLS